MRISDSAQEAVGGSQTPSPSRPSHNYPRPEVDEPPNATTVLHRSLGADVRPGVIARSDDAPHIWAEINKLSHNFGRLEKQIEQANNDLSQHRQVIDDVKRDTKSLCANHDQNKVEIHTSGNSSSMALQAAEQRLGQKLEQVQGTASGIKESLTQSFEMAKGHLDTKIGDIKTDLATATTAISELKTEQSSNAKLLKFVAFALPALSVAIPVGGTWFWNNSVQPGIEKNVEKSVLAELAKQKAHEDKLAEANRRNEALQRENEELKRNQKK